MFYDIEGRGSFRRKTLCVHLAVRRVVGSPTPTEKAKRRMDMHRSFCLLFVVKIETLVEAINTSAGINELLLTCKERMAF